jgi:hypothetical protein
VADGRKNNGGARKGAGRKPKKVEQTLIDRLSRYDDVANDQLIRCVKDGAPWAIKLFFEYRYGKPKQTMDVTSDGKAINPAIIAFSDD